MYKLKGCRHCGGDLALYRDQYGKVWTCLNCAREVTHG